MRTRLQAKADEARGIITEAMRHTPAGVPLIVNFSGGKDSSCVLNLVMDVTQNVMCFYMASGQDLPGAIDYARESVARFGQELEVSYPEDYQGDLVDLVRRWRTWPLPHRPWCSGRLKIRPGRAFLRKRFGRTPLVKLTGVRKAESSRRSRMYDLSAPAVPDPEHSGSRLVHPILSWEDEDVREFLESHDPLPPSPLYKAVGVSGCFWCIFYTPSIIQAVERMWPGIHKPFTDAEAEVGKPAMQGYRYLRDIVAEAYSEGGISHAATD